MKVSQVPVTSQIANNTITQTKDFDMVSQIFPRQGKQRWGEEHGFIVRVSNQQTDTFVTELGKGCARDVRGVKPSGR